MTVKLFYQNPYQTEFEAKVVEVIGNDVVLDQTCFFPQGGGQVGDTGELSGVRVIDTIKSEDKKKIFHVLEKPVFKAGDSVKGKIDWERRYKTMKLHSVSHITMHFMKEVFGDWCNALPAALVDDKKDRSTYTFNEPVNMEKLKLVEKKTNEFIARNLEIKTWSDAKNPNYRYWKCDTIELPCGGTSVKATKEIGKIIIEKGKTAGAGKQKIETMLAGNVPAEAKQQTANEMKKVAETVKAIAGDDDKSFKHWADAIAEKVEERVKTDPILNKVVKEKGFYLVYDEKTPSGKIHIGAGRGWIIHDAVAKALRDRGLKAKFILSADDMDPFDAMPKYLDAKKYEKYMGIPFRNVPSPVPGYKNYADYYFRDATDKFPEFGIECELASTGQDYIDGKFNATIKIALDNAEKIQNIYKRFSREGSIGTERIPFNPICEKCGKIATTYVTEWNSEKGTMKYKCMENLVTWATGCGYEGERSPYNGGGKFPWKVEWAAKWPTQGVVMETAGKDHFSKGGSRSVAIAIADEVFNYPPPYPSTRTETGDAYEFFTIGGQKMSTSKGRGISFSEMTNYAPANLLRYLLIKTRPHAVIDFDPVGTNKLILLFEAYDKTERIYYGKEKVENEREAAQEKRVYELSHVGPVRKTMPPQIPFTHAAMLVQVLPDIASVVDSLKSTGHVPQKPSKEDEKYVLERLSFVKKWVTEFAPDEYKVVVHENVPDEIKKKFSAEQISALKMLAASLENKKTETELGEEFKKIIADAKITPQDFYKACYLAIIGKERGPKLAGFIVAVGADRVKNVLKTV